MQSYLLSEHVKDLQDLANGPGSAGSLNYHSENTLPLGHRSTCAPLSHAHVHRTHFRPLV